MATKGSRRAIVAAFLANLGIAVAKFVGYALTGAASMLAEGVHSLADTSNQGLLILGGRRAQRPPDRQHPFGHERERYFWAFVVALVIFSGGGLFALYEGIEKLRHPHTIDGARAAILILVVALVLEAASLRTAVTESRAVKSEGSWWDFVRHSKVPELPVVLLEDTAALVGLACALVGVSLAEVTGNSRFDALGSLAIGAVLTSVALVLSVEMKSLLIGESASPDQLEKICTALEGTPGIRRVIHLRTEHLGPDSLLVAGKIAVDGQADSASTARLIDRAEEAVRTLVPEARLIYLEPDIDRRA